MAFGSRVVPVIGATALASYGALQVLGRAAGSTAAERAVMLPGDDLVRDPQLVTDHGVTIDAPPERVWPWLTQLGWHLGGWYTPHWVDRLLFPDNWKSLDRLDPHLVRDLALGDTIPDGPPGTAEYVVARVEPPRLLVLRSTTHVPPGWDQKYGARITWTWTLRLTRPADRSGAEGARLEPEHGRRGPAGRRGRPGTPGQPEPGGRVWAAEAPGWPTSGRQTDPPHQ